MVYSNNYLRPARRYCRAVNIDPSGDQRETTQGQRIK